MKIMLLLLLAGCAAPHQQPGDVCEVVGLYCFDPEAK